MTSAPAFTHRLRVAHLNPRAANPVLLEPDAQARKAIAAELGLLRLPALRLEGRITAQGNDAWLLSGNLTARVVQPCVVTLAPVESSIDDEVRRIFSPHAAAPVEEEVEMPDDEMELLGQFIDAGAVMIEALALALPLYPRAEGAELPEQDDTPDEEDERQKPFAGLDALLSKTRQ
ncbi:YceD family protein [Paracoccus tegillarcae]|uniref:DUF177 domain-containing protein n=1 Tax=Paracoccus tegillarcae TaxID=1529068 RepID=A0A2K9ESL4_9RHOB|nr:DUF177 domain-containing protein [Paracoccus tegillarcae]AUH32194.1 hypothetical protein CUV01_01175 [Paracoccus tegillarcae]